MTEEPRQPGPDRAMTRAELSPAEVRDIEAKLDWIDAQLEQDAETTQVAARSVDLDKARKILTILCSRTTNRHVVGAARSTPSGYVVTYVAAVRTSDGWSGIDDVWLEADAAEGADAWCRSCKKVLSLDLNGVLTAVRSRQPSLTLSTSESWRSPS